MTCHPPIRRPSRAATTRTLTTTKPRRTRTSQNVPSTTSTAIPPTITHRTTTTTTSTAPAAPSFVYHEVVRNRQERQELPCYDCPNCAKFYQALRHAGHDEEDIAVLSSSSRRHGDGPTSSHQQHRGFGRHRARFRPNSTPEDFWELDFIDER